MRISEDESMGDAMQRTNISSASPWEPVVGYSRAVRIGPHIWVAGTSGTDENGELIGLGDAEAQARRALVNIGSALQRAGGSLADVVRTRIYMVDANDWRPIGRVHQEVFGSIRPVSIMVAVSGFVHPAMLLEIEADAFVRGNTA
jgi:enamine deaminase RidA (YjgF/YER057c/UK114 family)